MQDLPQPHEEHRKLIHYFWIPILCSFLANSGEVHYIIHVKGLLPSYPYNCFLSYILSSPSLGSSCPWSHQKPEWPSNHFLYEINSPQFHVLIFKLPESRSWCSSSYEVCHRKHQPHRNTYSVLCDLLLYAGNKYPQINSLGGHGFLKYRFLLPSVSGNR